MSETNELDEVVREFLVESHESLDQLDRDLVALEKDPGSTDRLSSVFRTIHTIKGTCGFLSFGKLESVAHVGENLLSRLRDGRLTLDAEITTALLAMVDAVRRMLSTIEDTGTDGEHDYADLIARLNHLQEALEGPDDGAAGAVPTSHHAGVPDLPAEPAAPEPVAKTVDETSSAPASPSVVAGEAIAAEAGEARQQAISDSTIRVDVHLLEKLMNLAGELVLARNQVLQFAARQQDTSFVGTTQRLNLITTELQEGVMKTRMQPIRTVWSKFPRVIRDLAVQCGKRVRIDMEGEDTELDRTVLEAIKDPLTHIVRNSVDHGLEKPEVRAAAGKSAEGRVQLRAFHEGGHVNIEISDDGRGLDVDRIRAKALERGLVSPERLARMSERDVLGLIFLPGFSTAEQITNVSGRGVGMDVVKTNVEKIGGTIDIQSRAGMGTTLKIKIPLTLAIIPALVVTSGSERFAIPQVSLLELVRLDGTQHGIEEIHGARVCRLRGNLLPLVDLDRELGLRAATAAQSDSVNIVVLQADDRQFGLIVESINDTEEIVVKPLGMQLKGIPTFAGATIMGDGRVALILDVVGLAQRAGVISELRDRGLGETTTAQTSASAGERQTLLLFSGGEGVRLAIPLSLVARLEEFPASVLERSGSQEVVQYRGCIMPLYRLSEVLGLPAAFGAGTDDPLQVIVYAESERSVGLVVDRILDIVEESLTVRREIRRHGILGSAVIQNRVTDLIDVHAIIHAADPAFFAAAAA